MPDFTQIKDENFILITTFRKSGVGVQTPVWFVLRDGRAYVWTDKTSGKIKRLRNKPNLTLAPCTATGKPTGPAMECQATIIDGEEGESIYRLFLNKYGVQMRAFSWLNRKHEQVFLEITPAVKVE
jgi:PPOX class probable F420-dependent enzyme